MTATVVSLAVSDVLQHSNTMRISRNLAACEPEECVVVGSVDAVASRIDRLASVGILPGVELRVQQTQPVVIVQCDETVLALEREIASSITVVTLQGESIASTDTR